MKKAFSIFVWLVLSGAILFSGYNLEKKLNEYRTELDKKTTVSSQVRQGRTVDFDRLKSMNKDVRGWIWLKGSQIDYPIVQSDDNDYYLHRDLDGNYLFEGTLFIDCANEHPFEDFNTVIYGHFMYSGSMFGSLREYEDEEYFKKNNAIVLETEDGSYDLHVVAICNEPADSDLYTTFFYSPEMIEGTDLISKEGFIDLVKDKAIVLTDEPFDVNDRFVTLSTCAYNYEDARTQVIGVLRPAGMEEVKTVTETEKPLLNKWLLMQIGLGALMAAVIAGAGISVLKRSS